MMEQGFRTLFSCALIFLVLASVSGCAGLESVIGAGKIKAPPEYNQEIILRVSDDYKQFQATRSGYDIGDLQSFQSQHTFPVVAEDAFRQIFGKITMQSAAPEASIETAPPDVPAIFEVRMLDLANDISMKDADNYRATCLIAVAMKSPKGNIFWQDSFRGDGYIKVDPQFSTGLGPQDAVIDAVRDALDQMQKAIVASPAVRNQMKYYLDIVKARQETEKKI
jgi:hypothetical protein